MDGNNGVKVSKAIFKKQLSKGRIGEAWFLDMARQHWDEVYDYTNFDMWKETQKMGIDFGFKNKNWSNEITTDVKSNLYYSEYQNDWEFGIEYLKWHHSKKNEHKREEEDGWVQDSKSDRIYHTEVTDGFATGRYVYYDLHEMRNFIYREWDKSEDSWIRKLSYISGKMGDYTQIIPVRMSEEKFKPYIRKWEI